MWKEVKKFASDLLFPIFCLGCHTEGVWCCNQCQNSIPLDPQFASPPSSFPFAQELSGIFTLLPYQEYSLFARLLHTLKYNWATNLTPLLSKIISSSLQFSQTQYWLHLFRSTPAFVLPIPLASRRERERGFNQAALVARAYTSAFSLSEKINISSDLVRSRHTSQQARLNKNQREANVVGAFMWNNPTSPPPTVILIDDLITTGATMSSAAQALKQAGAKHVYGFALARG